MILLQQLVFEASYRHYIYTIVSPICSMRRVCPDPVNISCCLRRSTQSTFFRTIWSGNKYRSTGSQFLFQCFIRYSRHIVFNFHYLEFLCKDSYFQRNIQVTPNFSAISLRTFWLYYSELLSEITPNFSVSCSSLKK